ncbi:hypothetical protein EDC35_10445 [Thiobaca trueperi]|uniref:Uncharacterized protein n=1 Tax=Thiobaca trueperi TaxID=127458 RepID=A0A4V2V1H0_9GAMM|nr:hypothetical protein EDC35_10445 [Thiobaca trueperi]
MRSERSASVTPIQPASPPPARCCRVVSSRSVLYLRRYTVPVGSRSRRALDVASAGRLRPRHGAANAAAPRRCLSSDQVVPAAVWPCYASSAAPRPDFIWCQPRSRRQPESCQVQRGRQSRLELVCGTVRHHLSATTPAMEQAHGAATPRCPQTLVHLPAPQPRTKNQASCWRGQVHQLIAGFGKRTPKQTRSLIADYNIRFLLGGLKSGLQGGSLQASCQLRAA